MQKMSQSTHATPESRGRNPQGYGGARLSPAARMGKLYPEAEVSERSVNRRGTEPYARWCERLGAQAPRLLDSLFISAF